MTTSTQSSVDMAAARSMQAGRLLLSERALTNGVNDSRLDRADLKVLACIVMLLRSDHKAEFTRATLSFYLGLSPKTVSNRLSRLRKLGYLVSEPIAGTHKQITAFGEEAIRLSEIEAAITKHVNDIRNDNVPPIQGTNDPSPQGTAPDEGKECTPLAGNSQKNVPLMPGTSPDAGNGDAPDKGNSRARDIDSSTTTKESESKSASPKKRGRSSKTKGGGTNQGRRLPDDWRLGYELGKETADKYVATREQIHSAAEDFKNYWIAASGKNAIKLNWTAAWWSWCNKRVEFGQWRRRDKPGADAVEPSLLDYEPKKPEEEFKSMWTKEELEGKA